MQLDLRTTFIEHLNGKSLVEIAQENSRSKQWAWRVLHPIVLRVRELWPEAPHRIRELRMQRERVLGLLDQVFEDELPPPQSYALPREAFRTQLDRAFEYLSNKLSCLDNAFLVDRDADRKFHYELLCWRYRDGTRDTLNAVCQRHLSTLQRSKLYNAVTLSNGRSRSRSAVPEG